MIALAFLLMLAGFAAIATTMHATPRPLRAGNPRQTRWIGWALLLASLALALAGGRWDYGLMGWLGLGLPAAGIVLGVLAVARVRHRRNTPSHH